MANENIDVQFTARFVIKDAIDCEALQTDYNGDLLGYIRELTKSEGLQGCTEDEYEIVEAHELLSEVKKLKCRTIGTGTGSIIVGCGSEPCRCDAISAEMERVFGQSRAEAIAELEAELASPDNLPMPDDGVDALESWLS